MTYFIVMSKTSIAEVKARLSEYLERVERGERIVICRHNKPVAELVPVESSRSEPRPLGPLPGRSAFVIGEAFHEPLSADELAVWEGGALPILGKRAVGEPGHASRVAERKASYDGSAARGRRTRQRS
jgi:prevent-host-death family protein